MPKGMGHDQVCATGDASTQKYLIEGEYLAPSPFSVSLQIRDALS
jgi:hypothetical protein